MSPSRTIEPSSCRRSPAVKEAKAETRRSEQELVKTPHFNSRARTAPKTQRRNVGVGTAGDGEPALAVERPDEVPSAAH